MLWLCVLWLCVLWLCVLWLCVLWSCGPAGGSAGDKPWLWRRDGLPGND